MMTRAAPNNTGNIRPLNPARDLGQLADLIENAFGDELVDGGERVLRELRLLSTLGPLGSLITGVDSEIDGMFTGLVWEQDGRILGNVTVNRPTAHLERWQISNVAVLDTYRQRGIGRKLVEAAIQLVLKRGGETAYLFVRDDNDAALHLYRSLGFVEVDATTDLKLDTPPTFTRPPQLRHLRRLTWKEGQAMYELVSQATGPGYRWLSGIRKGQYVRSADGRLLQWLGSLFSGETETQWGMFRDGDLDAALSLRATRLWNHSPHQLKLWVLPEQRGKVEEGLARDVVALLAQQAGRPSLVSLPEAEEHAIRALVGKGFRKIRTLILMKLEL